MSQIQPIAAGPAPFHCRFEMTADAPPGREFCVFEFPGCEGCPGASHIMKMVRTEDPLKAAAWQAWLALGLHPGT
ncbi:MAG: hypothetical protein V4517_03105 [Pseudomonadota bacterium]